MKRLAPFVFFIGAMFAVGFSAAMISPVGEWYAALAKPSFNPPNWIFGPVWSVLYVMIGVAGALGWNSPRRNRLTGLWIGQLVLNGSWSLVFFGLHQPELALAVIVGMLALIIAFIATAWKPANNAALLFLPYAAWVSFAGVLNAALAWLN